ncbi:hypothetical protein [Microbacterium sp. G2-8]|uniref:hypothetical protein n=1 Tax=Microbacterium sp. G2-8 TaxID=2842454 RepID=UPI001C895049|nr:hypothetical protein [Microbacterium sp. G2-8]
MSNVPPELEESDDDKPSYLYERNQRIRTVAWIVIGSLILTGGGATVLLLLFG